MTIAYLRTITFFPSRRSERDGEKKIVAELEADLAGGNAVNHHGMYLPLLAPGQ